MPQLDLSCLQMSHRHLARLRELLAQAVPEASVWAYGSRVKGVAHEGSDLDLVLRHQTDLTLDVPGWLDLTESLQASELPMLIQVHQWSQLPESFHRNIEEGYVVLQA